MLKTDTEFENLLYQYASNEMYKAREWQNQISTKELSIELSKINEHYRFSNSVSMSISNMETELSQLKLYRNSCVHFAIEYALQLAEYEFKQEKHFLLSPTLFNTINTFNRLYGTTVTNSIHLIVPRLVELQTNLIKSDKMPTLLEEIDEMIKHFSF